MFAEPLSITIKPANLSVGVSLFKIINASPIILAEPVILSKNPMDADCAVNNWKLPLLNDTSIPVLISSAIDAVTALSAFEALSAFVATEALVAVVATDAVPCNEPVKEVALTFVASIVVILNNLFVDGLYSNWSPPSTYNVSFEPLIPNTTL